VQAALCCINVLAKPQDDAAFGFLDLVEAGYHPEKHNNRDDNPEADTAARRGTTPTATTAPATEQAAEFPLEILEYLIEVGRPLIAAITPGVFITVTARFIPGHVLLQIEC
jgi:hypothetical protein